MGYTHYWRVNPKHGKAAEQEKQYQIAVKQCQKIIKTYNDQIKLIDKKHPDRLQGYSAHADIGQYGGINFNGVGSYSHETFVFREHFKQNSSSFACCKTAQKPYDTVVVACLITMKHYLKDGIEVSSDGYAHDWLDGLELARRILKLKSLKIPKTIERLLRVVV